MNASIATTGLYVQLFKGHYTSLSSRCARRSAIWRFRLLMYMFISDFPSILAGGGVDTGKYGMYAMIAAYAPGFVPYIPYFPYCALSSTQHHRINAIHCRRPFAGRGQQVFWAAHDIALGKHLQRIVEARAFGKSPM